MTEPKIRTSRKVVDFGPEHAPPKIDDLDPATADLAAIIAKLNELLAVLRQWGYVE